MILTLLFCLLFGFTIFYALALAAAASPNPFQFLGDGVSKWRDDFDSDAIRSSRPTNGPETGVAGSQYAVKLVSHVPVHGSVSVAIPHCHTQSNKVETRTAVTPAIGLLFPKTEPNGLAVPGCSESQTAPKGLGSEVNKPLMKKPRAPLVYERHADRDTAGNTFKATPALGRRLKERIAHNLAVQPLMSPDPTMRTTSSTPEFRSGIVTHNSAVLGLLFCSGQLRKI